MTVQLKTLDALRDAIFDACRELDSAPALDGRSDIQRREAALKGIDETLEWQPGVRDRGRVRQQRICLCPNYVCYTDSLSGTAGRTAMSTVVQLRPPQSKNPTVTPRRGKNAEYRSREYLTEQEIEKLLATARKSRNPTRDSLLVLLAL